MNLDKKIDYSIALLRKAESMALRLDPENGFYLAFSGGKDSQGYYPQDSCGGAVTFIRNKTQQVKSILSVYVNKKVQGVTIGKKCKSMAVKSLKAISTNSVFIMKR